MRLRPTAGAPAAGGEPTGRQTDRAACLFHQSTHSVFRDDDDDDDDGSGAVGDNIIAIGREAKCEHAHSSSPFVCFLFLKMASNDCVMSARQPCENSECFKAINKMSFGVVDEFS